MLGELHMGWRHVCFANWAVDPEIVRRHLPSSLTVDTYDGEAWLSIVPFTNVDVRPTWWPAGWGLGLPELNLRTYVSHEGTAGVYFFSLDAEGLLGVIGARLFHHLPYYYARIDLRDSDGTIEFTSRRRHPGARPLEFRAQYAPTGERFTADAGTLEHFLTERYRYYTETQGGALRYARIEHEPWPLTAADVDLTATSIFNANGFALPDGEPVYLYSPGVDTCASASRPV